MNLVELRFASNVVVVSQEEVAEFERRLRAMPGGDQAADELRDQHRLAGTDQKSLALSALNAWMADGLPLGGGLRDVRYELMRDLALPPFDD